MIWFIIAQAWKAVPVFYFWGLSYISSLQLPCRFLNMTSYASLFVKLFFSLLLLRILLGFKNKYTWCHFQVLILTNAWIICNSLVLFFSVYASLLVLNFTIFLLSFMSLWQKYSDQGTGTKDIWFAILVTVCHCLKVSKAGGWNSWSYPLHIQGHFCSPRFLLCFVFNLCSARFHPLEGKVPSTMGWVN